MKKLPKQSYLKDLFIYNSENGEISWRNSRRRVAANTVISCISSEGYNRLGLDGVRYYVHRIIWKIVYGCDPIQIDHINGDRSDNRIVNLRSVEQKINARNQRKHCSNKSGFTGVVWESRYNKWYAQIVYNKKYYFLGSFDLIKDAIKARKSAELKFKFHANHGT